MADLKLEGKNNQKRGVSVFVSESITVGTSVSAFTDTLFTLPANSLVTSGSAIVTDATGNTGDILSLLVGSETVVGSIPLDAVELSIGTVDTTKAYRASGGTVYAAGTSAANPSTYKVVMEYVELNKTTGEFTN